MNSRNKVSMLALVAACLFGASHSFALDPKDSADFPHALEFETDNEIPSVEGAADGWQETAWNIVGQPISAPTLEVSGGLLKFNSFSASGTAAGTPWIHMDGGSAWEAEVDGTTSYTLEMEVQVLEDIGGMIIWAGNGSNRLLLRVGTGSISADGPGGELNTDDNSAAPILLRIAYDGGAQTYDIYRDGALIGDDVAPSAGDGNNRLILFDCCGSTAARGELEFLRWVAGAAHAPAVDSSTFAHKLEFETDGEVPSVEGAADGWVEVNGWNVLGGETPRPSLEVSGGTMKLKTVGVGGGHDIRQPTDTSAWAQEVDPGTSYTFETRLRVTDQGGTQPGFTFWLGNGVASQTAVLQIRTDEVMHGRTTAVLHEGDNATDFVTIRIAHDGDTGLQTVWRNGIEIGTDLGPSDLQHANNWVILADFGGANECDAELDYIRWDATGAYAPAAEGDGRDASTFAHKLLFDTDNEIPSVEGAADGWQETAWNIVGQPISAPTLEVSGGLLKFNSFSASGTAAGTPWIHMDGGSAWEAEVDGTTSYTLEMEVQVLEDIGGMIIWAGNGSNRLLLRVGTGSISADGPGGELNTDDNSAAPILLRIAYDGGAQTYDIYRDGALIGDDVAPSAGDGNNRLILFDCCGSTAARGELEFLRWVAGAAHAPAVDSSTFAHKLEFETDGEVPSVEGAADGWVEVNGWNVLGGETPRPSLEVSGGTMKLKTVGVGGGHDIRQPTDTSAWAQEVDPGTSYTFETRLRVTDQGGTQPGFTFWLGNGVASQTAVLQIRTDEVMHGRTTAVLHEGDNATDFVTIRIAHDGDTGLQTVWRNGIEIGTDLGPSDLQHANNWVILADFGGANECDAELDYICWDATGAYPPPGGGPDVEPPAAPTGLIAQSGVGAISLDWDANSEDDVAGYNVYRSASQGGGGGVGGYELIAEGVGPSAFTDEGTEDGVEMFYIVTAVDASENESAASDEVSATSGFGPESDPDSFARCLLFDTDGELPDVEGAADGGTLSATWNATEGELPTLSVEGGLLRFSSALPGQHSLDQPDDGISAWSTTISGSTSYTFETSVRTSAAEGGTVLWLANGGNRIVVVVGTNSLTTLGGLQLHEGDNTSRLVNIRVGYDGVTQRYFIWRNGILVGDGVPPDAATARKAIFLIDCCSSIIVEGEMDYACWDATGVYPPATIVDETPPGAPTGLVAEGAFGIINLDWDTNPEDDVLSYNVFRGEAAGGPYDLLAEGVAISAYADTDVDDGVEYFYVVTAVDASDNESDTSNEASASSTAPPEAGPFGFPHCLLFEENGVLPSVEGAATGWAEDAAWNQNDPDPPTLTTFDGRLIFETVAAGQQSITLQDGSAWANEIDSSTSYTFDVRLRVTASSEANAGAILWLANGSTRFILRVDTNATYIFGGEQLDEGDNSQDFVDFRIGYDGSTGRYYVWRNGTLIGSALPATGAAANGRTAVFLIDCCTSVQVAGEFDHACWTSAGLFSPDLTAPAAPTNLVATAGEAQVSLEWNDSADGDVIGYDVARSESRGGPYDLIGFSESSSFVDDTAMNNVEYFYVVNAVDAGGNRSDDSNEAGATPRDVTAPAAPINLVATAGDTEVSLDWDDNVEGDLAGYNIVRSETAGGPYAELADLVAASEYVDDAVVNGVTYYYVVTAVDTSENESEISNEAEATPIAPGALRLPGDCNEDNVVDLSDALCLFGFLFTGQTQALPCGDGSLADPANVQLLDWNGDDLLDLSDGASLLNFLFLGGVEHAQGLDCIRVIGCEGDNCVP